MGGENKKIPTIVCPIGARAEYYHGGVQTFNMTIDELMAHFESMKDRFKGQTTTDWSKPSLGVDKHESTSNESNN